MIHRRIFLAGAAGLAAARLAGEDAPPKAQYFELRFYHLQPGEGRRMHEWAAQRLLPLMKKHNFGPAGFFHVVVGPQMALVVLLSYSSLAEREAAWQRLTSDPEWAKAVEALESSAEPPFERADSTLLRALPYSPLLVVSPAAKKPRRLFELRIYELLSERQLRGFHRFFSNHVVGFFHKHGLGQVFYGEGVIGSGLPNLTYMLVFETWADHEKAWATFSADPDRVKLFEAAIKELGPRGRNLTNMLLHPTAYSPIQ